MTLDELNDAIGENSRRSDHTSGKMTADDLSWRVEASKAVRDHLLEILGDDWSTRVFA